MAIPPTFVLLLCGVTNLASSWDPDAGMITSYTKSGHATVTATSGNTPENVIDGNDNTNWVSGSCLPSYYFKRPDVNVLFGACAAGRCTLSSTTGTDLQGATDGDSYTSAHFTPVGSQAKFSLMLEHPVDMKVLSVSGVYHSNTTLYAYYGLLRTEIRVFSTTDNYKTINILNLNVSVSGLELVSESDFVIKDIAAIGPNGCMEKVTVDLGALVDVGTIRTRHWAGSNAASELKLMLSVDGTSWTTVANLDPNALHAVTTNIVEQKARFIALEYSVVLTNYKKVYCFEIDAWDENGIWGPKFIAAPQNKNFRELLGVNGIWGWGTNKYSDSLGSNEGPLLYSQVSSHARNYHNLKWDVSDPDLDPEYAKMAAGHGTQATWWLNWDREYKAWRDANMTLDVSIQFTNKTAPQNTWDHPEQAAYQYGREFAKHFGPTHGNGYVTAVEVGNEPWDYDAAFYASVLKGMSAGIRNGDDKLTVVAGTFQAQDKLEANTYIGTRVLEEAASNIDVINCHTYSFVNDANGVRRGTFPEHKNSMFNNIRPLMRWRNANMPTAPLWVTEWGWDADGLGESCRGTECVSDKAQAVYGIRGLLILARNGIERATWYFYANLDCDTLFCRSGLTTSFLTHFQRKTVFRMFEDLLQNIGDAYFLGTIKEDDNGFIYALCNSCTTGNTVLNGTDILSKATHLFAWLPVDINDPMTRHHSLAVPNGVHVDKAIRFTGNSLDQTSQTVRDVTITGHTLTFTMSTEPVLISLRHGHHTDPIVG